MDKDANYIKTVMNENYILNDNQNISFDQYIKRELKENLESFDCFFDIPVDELRMYQKYKRVLFLENTLEVFKNKN